MERTRIDLDASPYFASTVPIESATPTVMLLPPGVDPDTARAIIAATTPPAAPGAAELTAVAEAECDCADAIEYVVITGRATRCQLCGAPLEPTGGPRPVRFVPAADELVRRATLPGPAPDARVSVVRDPRPSSAPVERVTHVEDHLVVRLRRLVVDLRVVELDGAGAPAIVYRERVQTSGGSFDGPRIGAATVRHPVTDRLVGLRAAHPKEVATLVWLRAWGPAYDLLAAGKASLVLAQCARALGSEAQHAAWAKAPAGAEVWARAALERAAVVWWGEGLDTGASSGSNAATRPLVANGRALSAPPADPRQPPST